MPILYPGLPVVVHGSLGMMCALVVLAVLAVAPVSGAAEAPADGAALFAELCATCHGPAGRGLAGRPDIRCHRSIGAIVRAGRGEMPAFPDLSDAQIAALQQNLHGVCRRPTAAQLYAANCGGCHGRDGAGTDRGPLIRCATRVRDAVRRGRDEAMPALPGLMDAEVAQLQSYLDARCAARGRPTADVYRANCATCHGADGAGGRNALWIEGPDIRCTAHADWVASVEEGAGGMPAFPALGRQMIEALLRHVRGQRCDGS